jgi:hypothetical protein
MFRLPNLRRRRSLAAAAALAAATTMTVAAGVGSPAHAGELPPELAKFANCPVQDPEVVSCIYIETTSAALDAGLFRGITAPSPIVLQFGTKFDLVEMKSTSVAPTNGVPALKSPPMRLPGGLAHHPWVDGGPLAAYITPQIIGLPQLNLDNLNTPTDAPVLQMKLRAKVHNPFTDVLSALGNGCYIGKASDPIDLNLTTGTTSPPRPNQPITGNPGHIDFSQVDKGLITITDLKVVDNAWGLPHATGCGPLGTFNWAVDLDAGHPFYDDPGHNSAVMTTTVYQADAEKVREALAAP